MKQVEESCHGHPGGKNEPWCRVRYALLLCMSLLPYMEASFSFPDFVRIVSQPVIHRVYTSYFKTVLLSKLQLYLHIFYIGNGHVHRQGFPFTSLHVVWLFAKTLKTCMNLWAVVALWTRHIQGLSRPGQAEQS